jgi:hypothetical protein
VEVTRTAPGEPRPIVTESFYDELERGYARIDNRRGDRRARAADDGARQRPDADPPCSLHYIFGGPAGLN